MKKLTQTLEDNIKGGCAFRMGNVDYGADIAKAMNSVHGSLLQIEKQIKQLGNCLAESVYYYKMAETDICQ